MRILNLNLDQQENDWTKRLSVLSNLLRENYFRGRNDEQNAKHGNKDDDILVFTSILNNDAHQQLAEINQELGYSNIYFFETFSQQETTRGLGILTNLNGSREQIHLLDRDKHLPIEDPPALGLIELGEKRNTLTLAIVSFSNYPKSQLSNAQEVIYFTNQFNAEKPDQASTILCVDLSSNPIQQTIQCIENQGFFDAIKATGQREFATWPIAPSLVKQVEKPREPVRRNYIFSRGLSPKLIRRVGNKENGVWHSNHWGVLAEF